MLAPIRVQGVDEEVSGGSQEVFFDYGGYPTTTIRVRGEGAMHLGIGQLQALSRASTLLSLSLGSCKNNI